MSYITSAIQSRNRANTFYFCCARDASENSKVRPIWGRCCYADGGIFIVEYFILFSWRPRPLLRCRIPLACRQCFEADAENFGGARFLFLVCCKVTRMRAFSASATVVPTDKRDAFGFEDLTGMPRSDGDAEIERQMGHLMVFSPAIMTARSRTLRSSRTLPGQEYFLKASMTFLH